MGHESYAVEHTDVISPSADETLWFLQEILGVEEETDGVVITLGDDRITYAEVVRRALEERAAVSAVRDDGDRWEQIGPATWRRRTV